MASVAKRTDGSWRARYRDEAGLEHARHFDRRVDAQRWIDEVTTSVVSGQYVDPRAGRVSFAGYYAEWSVRQLWESTTFVAMDLAARGVPFSDMPLASVRRSHVEQWVKQMTVRGLAPGTIRTRVNNVRSVLRAAVRDRVIVTDPSVGVTLPRIRRAEAAMHLPGAEDVAALMHSAEPRFKAFIAVAAFSGLRLGEAAGLQVGDVDYLRKSMAVTRQVQRAGGGKIEVRPPKYGSERVVFLADELIELLSRHVASHCPGKGGNRWMFEASPGTPPHQNTVGYWWRQTCRRADITGVTLHDLRHFYASGLIAAGCDVVTVQRALGHAKATTTLNTYAHLWPTAEDRTRKASGSLMKTVADSLADSLRMSGT